MIIIAIISTITSFWLGCQIIKRVDDIEKSYWAALPIFILGMAIVPGIIFTL